MGIFCIEKHLPFYTSTTPSHLDSGCLFGGKSFTWGNGGGFWIPQDSAAEQEHEASKAYEPPRLHEVYIEMLVVCIGFLKRHMDDGWMKCRIWVGEVMLGLRREEGCFTEMSVENLLALLSFSHV